MMLESPGTSLEIAVLFAPINYDFNLLVISGSAPFFDGLQNSCDDLIPRLRAEVALPVDADAHGIGFHVTVADDESRFCGMDFHLLVVRDVGFDVVAELRLDGVGVGEQRSRSRGIANAEEANLLGREPDREVPGVMFDEEADECSCMPRGAR
jgi:hypothetical protein